MPDKPININLKDIDLVFVSYDEPGKQVFFNQAKKIWPGNVKHVDGVKGIHLAYSKADEVSSTDWFMIIDGDTWLWDTMDRVISDSICLPKQEIPCVYSFGSMNEVNRLCYGNGGPKLWKKGLLSTEKTHEKKDNGVSLDFFTTFRYYQIDMVFSTTVINQTPLQAVRAGYRESVKFLSQNGKIGKDWKKVMKEIAGSNLSRVHIWCSTGADINNGYWAIYGARKGIEDFWTNTSSLDSFINNNDIDRYLILNDYDLLSKYLSTLINNVIDPVIECERIGDKLKTYLDFYVPLHDKEMSKWIKTIYQNPSRNGFI